MTSVLDGVTIVEFGGIGPAPHGCMLLAEMGATVIRIDRPNPPEHVRQELEEMATLLRGRRRLPLDLKSSAGRDVAFRLIAASDVVVEAGRPGVMERFGLGPQDCLELHPSLVYARVTGWGRGGPLAQAAGYDINFLALSGALYHMGPADSPPPPPLNLVADYGGGGAYLAIGVLGALLERSRSGAGQVVDVSMTDGVASLSAYFFGALSAGGWSPERGRNMLDGAAPFYRTYTTADGGFIAVGAVAPKFYANFLRQLGLDASDYPQWDRERWPAYIEAIAKLVARHDRDYWTLLFTDAEACVSPVLSFAEVADHPHHVARGTYDRAGPLVVPVPSPRFGRTPSMPRDLPAETQEETEILGWLNYSPEDIARLTDQGALG